MSKVVLITGGTRGIGKSILEEYVKKGYSVAFTYRANRDKALEIEKEFSTNDKKVKGYQVEVANIKEIEDCVKEVIGDFLHIDVLVNNAGITKDNLIMRMKESEWDDVIDINLKGSFYFIKYVSKFMMKKRVGSIINVVSVAGISGNVGQANYSASKAGLIGLTKTCAKELASRNIRVNAIAPGFIDTDMTSVLSEDIKEIALKQIPLSRFGKPSEVAEVVAFISESSYITGQVISVDGGLVF